jgi:PAS domain S-box-containing protein
MDRPTDDASEAREDSLARFRGILEGVTVGIAWFEADGGNVACNTALARMFGYTRDELRDRVAALLAPPDDAEDRQLLAELLAGTIDHYRLERRYPRRDGQPMWGLLTVSLGASGPAGRPVIRVLDDITYRRRAQDRLAAQHAVARILEGAATLADATPRLLEAICQRLRWDVGGLWLVDRDSATLRAVDLWHSPHVPPTAFVDLTKKLHIEPGMGIPGQAWSGGRPVWAADVREHPSWPRALVTAQDGLHAAFAFPIHLCGEVLGVMDFFSREIREPDAELLLMFGAIGSQIGQFIERKRAEEDLHRLAAQLSAAEDAERRRLARDIHDSLGQGLSVVKMDLEAALQESAGHERSSARLSRSLGLMTRLIDETRTLTFDLYPSMLDDLGLIPTLLSYVEQQAGGPLPLSLSEAGERRALPGPVANYLFRSIKELFNNARKHAHATAVFIAVHWQKGALRIMVVDDGRGFDPVAALAPEHRRGLGLADLRERVRSLGGQFLIESRPGQGTQVILEVPLEAAPRAAGAPV